MEAIKSTGRNWMYIISVAALFPPHVYCQLFILAPAQLPICCHQLHSCTCSAIQGSVNQIFLVLLFICSWALSVAYGTRARVENKALGNRSTTTIQIYQYLVCYILLGVIHKLRHTLRGGRGRRSMTLCGKGGGILNFVTSHFKNSIKAILHI